MKLTSKKTAGMIMSGLAAASLALTGAAPALAITASEATNQSVEHQRAVDNIGNTQYWLQISEDGDPSDPDNPGGLDSMSVDVPMRVTLAVDAAGGFVTPTALKNVIENKSAFPLDVTKMSLTTKNGFTNVAATGFDSSATANIYNGKISSTTLNADRTAVQSAKQSVAFTKMDTFATNAAWRMEASDNNARYGDDCLYIQLDGALKNVKGKYFTAPINVFDITYTFAAASADAAPIAADIAD